MEFLPPLPQFNSARALRAFNISVDVRDWMLALVVIERQSHDALIACHLSFTRKVAQLSDS